MVRQESAVSRVRKRDACDRCHEMKSRCNRSAGSASCIRCEKSGGQCHFSEALRAGRPKKRAPGPLKQESSTPSLETSRVHKESSALDIRREASDATVENGMDMLNFASPLPDLFISPQPMDEHMQTTTSDSTFESWLSVNPSDMQIVHPDDHEMSPFASPAQCEPITPDQFRTSSSSISSASSRIQDWSRQELETSSLVSQDDIAQQLLYLHSTLQRSLTVYNNGGVLTWDDTWTPQTAVEQIFITTDKLVAVLEALSLQSAPSTPQSGRNTPASASGGNFGRMMRTQSGSDSTSLLVLSCYICALEVYQMQVDSMSEQVNDIINQTCKTAQQGNSESSTRASSLISSANIMPVLNIGQFNLGLSPIRNLSLLLHLMQEMVERLHEAVQYWSVTQTDGQERTSPHRNGETSGSWPQPELSRSHKDSVLDQGRIDGARHAISSVFDSILASVGNRERTLRVSMQEVKDTLKKST
ncbi:hypothetical protein DE146DRAFT_330536 [Phaeosphaeria sp. MPI-PUGE-AT-0046c]|nr:hypothetical protein DE146DRAFT_330536 [Phaeosphaeria sp. MPI-PUGE-AT-0046c]